MISLIVLGYQRLCSNLKPQIELNWITSFKTCISQFNERYPRITLPVTYPWISHWYFVLNRIQSVYLTCRFSNGEKRQAGISQYKCTCLGISLDKSQVKLSWDIPQVLGYPWIRRDVPIVPGWVTDRSSYPRISHIFGISLDTSWQVINTGISQVMSEYLMLCKFLMTYTGITQDNRVADHVIHVCLHHCWFLTHQALAYCSLAHVSHCWAPRAIEALKLAPPGSSMPMHTKREMMCTGHAHQQHNTNYDWEAPSQTALWGMWARVSAVQLVQTTSQLEWRPSRFFI